MFCIFEIAMLVMGIIIVSKGEIRMGGKVCRGLPAYAVGGDFDCCLASDACCGVCDRGPDGHGIGAGTGAGRISRSLVD